MPYKRFANSSNIELSKDSLTIITDKDDDTAAIILKPFTERISHNRYRTNYTFFLKDYKNKQPPT